MIDLLIDGLWILDIESGSCLFEENYIKWSAKDTQLISSFLTAIRSFTKEAFSEEIQFIQFKSRKIIFEISYKILFVIAVNNSDLDDEILKKTIKKLIIQFNTTFDQILTKKNFANEFKKFKSFSDDLRRIIDRKPMKIRLISEGKIERLYQKRRERKLRRLNEIKRCM